MEFPDQGDRVVYLQKSGEIAQPPVAPRTANGKSIDLETSLDPAADGQDVLIVVVDKKSGDAATKALPDAAKTGTWKVADKDYTRVAEVRFEVRAKEGPVASGIVVVQGKSLTSRVMLAQSDKGSVSWRLVEPGEVKVSFEYKSEGLAKTLPAQAFEIKMGAGKPTVFVLDVTDKVDVVKPEPEPKKEEPAPATKAEAAKTPAQPEKEPPAAFGFLGNLLSMAFGLLAVGGVAYGLWWYVKNNQKQVESVLNQVGVPVGQDPADPVGDSPPVAPSAPQPLQKIVLDGATPGAASPSLVVARSPRLVAEDGATFPLGEGDNVVGREAGLPVSVLGEPSVSRNHATLSVGPGGSELKDLGSTNGTFVNGMKLSAAVALRPGDTVQFGARRFRYEE